MTRVIDIGASKREWRARAASIAPTTATESAKVATTIREVLRRQDWTVVLTFLPMPGEVDLSPLRADTELILAVTRTPDSGPLTIHLLEEPLERHRLGYLQPRAEATPINPLGIEAVLVPGVLFARNGGRLGHGMGYYDALLSSFHPRPYLIGATVDRRVVESLPMTATDVWMDAVATETGFRESVG
ncbi:MAG: 5-formyltetrahydrofolate cyclo-ligase [Acidimicrobiia bacterium]